MQEFSQIISSSICTGGGGKNPLLSIIVPVYNVEKYLRECLDSLVNQTLKDIEIIVVNDASPDNSEAIVLEYATQDPRIVYIKHEENKRQGAARNTGMKAARGQYIAFVDGDDYVDKHLYQSVIDAFYKNPVNMVFIPLYIFNNEKKLLSIVHFGRKNLVHFDAQYHALDWAFTIACDKVYLRQDLIDNKIYFPENTYWEDNPFWVKYCSSLEPFVAVLPKKGPAYWYRRHPDSVTARVQETTKMRAMTFFPIYQALAKYGHLDSLRKEFYDVISHLTANAWNILDAENQKEFLKHFYQFTQQIFQIEKCQQEFPEWYLMACLPEEKDRILLMEFYVRKQNLRHDRWYRFGQLSNKEKMIKIFQTIRRNILNPF